VEPEKNIEKELKAYAERRRAEAGTPIEPHPATRKMLQDEAARLARRAGNGMTSGASQWWNSLLRIAVGGCAVAALVVVCWIFTPMFSKERNKSNANSTMMALNQDRAKVPSTERAQEQPADKATTFKGTIDLSGQPPASPAPQAPVAAALAPAPAPAPVAAPATVASARAPVMMRPAATTSLPVDGGVPGVNTNAGSSFGFTGTFASLAGAPARPPISTNADYALDFVDVPAASNVQRFRRLDLANKDADDLSGATGGGQSVLSVFRVEQASEKLRVIDSDGSVYTGFVEKTPQDGKPVTRGLLKTEAKQSATSAASDEQKVLPTHIYRFRVSGTNRTLKEDVVFSGNFLMNGGLKELPAIEPTNGPIGGAPLPGAAGELQPLELRKARVEGRLLLGGTNKVEIKAEPAKP
jgi:hypothetical protein